MNKKTKNYFLFFLLTFLILGFFNKVSADIVDSSVEVLTAVEPTCGDGSCNGSETCSTCSADCGSCPASGGGGLPPSAYDPPTPPSPSQENPQGGFRVSINNGNKNTNNRTVILKLFGGPDTTKMAISNSPDFQNTGQESYQTSKTWTLFNIDGLKTVYAKFYNQWGRASEVVSDDIILDTIAPANVSNFRAEVSDEKINLAWTNSKDSDFAGVRINRSTKNYPLSPDQGAMIYNGSGTSFLDADVENGIKYFYSAFAFDKTGNYSSGAIVSAVLRAPLIPKIPIPPPKAPSELPSGIPPEIPEEIIPLIPLPPESPAAPEITLPKEKVELSDFVFRIQTGIGQIEISPEELGRIKIVKETVLFISIPANRFAKKVKVLTVTIQSDPASFLFKFNEKTNAFETTITAPPTKGSHKLTIIVVYENGTVDSISTEMLVDPFGYIFEKKKIKGETREIRIPEAKVTLFWFNSQENIWQQWPGEKFNQENPRITDLTGEYAFVVPEGRYYLEINKPGYYLKKSEEFEISEIINKNIEIKPILSLWQKFWRFFIILLIGLGAGIYFFAKKKIKGSKEK